MRDGLAWKYFNFLPPLPYTRAPGENGCGKGGASRQSIVRGAADVPMSADSGRTDSGPRNCDMKPSPQDLHAKLKHILRDAGFQDDNLVEVCSAPVGGHARYVVNILPGKARA